MHTAGLHKGHDMAEGSPVKGHDVLGIRRWRI